MIPIHLRMEQIRKEKGMTKTEVAKRCGRTVVWYSSISKGKRIPNANSIIMIANAMESDPRDFFAD